MITIHPGVTIDIMVLLISLCHFQQLDQKSPSEILSRSIYLTAEPTNKMP